MKNKCAKTRPSDRPYEVWKAGDWTWKVLKKYQNEENEAKNPQARWFCVVTSPHTLPSGDMGDVYVSDVKRWARLVSTDYDE